MKKLLLLLLLSGCTGMDDLKLREQSVCAHAMKAEVKSGYYRGCSGPVTHFEILSGVPVIKVKSDNCDDLIFRGPETEFYCWMGNENQ